MLSLFGSSLASLNNGFKPLEISQALAEAAHRKEYMNVQGHVPLRAAIAEFHCERENKQWHTDNIIIGSGSKILLFCVMAAFKKAEILLFFLTITKRPNKI